MIVREHVHAFQRKPPPISGVAIERRHRATLPVENCFELGNGPPQRWLRVLQRFCEHHVQTRLHRLYGTLPCTHCQMIPW